MRVPSFACSAVGATPCRAGVSGSGYIPWHVSIYRHLSTYPPSHLSTTPSTRIPVYLHPSITCGLVMRTARDDARDGPIIRHPIIRRLFRSASPFPFPLLFIPTNASAYAHRYRGICKERKIYRETRIYRETDTGICVCVCLCCVCLCGSACLRVLTVLTVYFGDLRFDVRASHAWRASTVARAYHKINRLSATKIFLKKHTGCSGRRGNSRGPLTGWRSCKRSYPISFFIYFFLLLLFFLSFFFLFLEG